MEFNENRPIYLQIADLVMEKIIHGVWKGGDRIPSVRELAVSLEVNPNTVIHAYGYLQDNGIIHNRRGIGYHVSEEGREAAKKFKREEFLSRELPGIFRAMQVLDIGIDEIKTLYDEYKIDTEHTEGIDEEK
ncbi:MAG: GntR family transcriptional regulator [Spirochaetaceae bacterium]